MNFPSMTHRLDFQPSTSSLLSPSLPPTLTSCPRGKNYWEEEVAIFLPHWILHMSQLKSINREGERSGKHSGTGLDCGGMGQACKILQTVALPMLSTIIFWPPLTFWQLQKEALTGVWIGGTALKEFACFVFHEANQISSILKYVDLH